MSEIRQKRLDFGRFRLLNQILNQTDSLCPKSECFQISEVDCTWSLTRPSLENQYHKYTLQIFFLCYMYQKMLKVAIPWIFLFIIFQRTQLFYREKE